MLSTNESENDFRNRSELYIALEGLVREYKGRNLLLFLLFYFYLIV